MNGLARVLKIIIIIMSCLLSSLKRLPIILIFVYLHIAARRLD